MVSQNLPSDAGRPSTSSSTQWYFNNLHVNLPSLGAEIAPDLPGVASLMTLVGDSTLNTNSRATNASLSLIVGHESEVLAVSLANPSDQFPSDLFNSVYGSYGSGRSWYSIGVKLIDSSPGDQPSLLEIYEVDTNGNVIAQIGFLDLDDPENCS